MVESNLNGISKFEGMAERITSEYIEEKGVVTAAFCTSEEFSEEKKVILNNLKQKLEGLDSVWTMYRCDNCKGHDENKPIHCEIFKKEVLHQISGKIKNHF